MNTALDRFERTLVAASHALNEQQATAAVKEHAGTDNRRSSGWRGRLRSFGLIGRAGIVIAALAGCGGVAAAAYTLLAGSQARRLPSYECELSNHVAAVINAVTGNPIADCATVWPSASGGRTKAPKLAIWGIDNNRRLVAIAVPVTLRSPGADWKRLPNAWTVSLPIVVLQDQLNNIDQPFTEVPQQCSYLRKDVADVRRLLRADGLEGWKIVVRGPGWRTAIRGSGRPVMNTCASTIPDIEGISRKVLLIQEPAAGKSPSRVHGSNGNTTRSVAERAAEHRATRRHHALLSLYTNVNRRLSRTCMTVRAATRLWARVAGRAGFSVATLSWWRRVNKNPRSADDKHYTLYQQPLSQHTGQCAHILVTDLGGPSDVYVARIAP